jgi:zinc D-Ala-D-Ala dipeptidase
MLKLSKWVAVPVLWLCLPTGWAADPKAGGVDLVDLDGTHAKFLFDIRYATPDNFAGVRIYPVSRCALRPTVAKKMVAAQDWLDQHHAGYRLVFKDCYRPVRAQKILWNAVRGTPKANYVANPYSKTGSIHCYGAAVDLTLADATGKEVDMGTVYDHLGPLAEPRLEQKYLQSGELTAAQVKRRHILRDAMKAQGMRPLANEWWHFNEASNQEVRRRYQPLDIPLSDLPAR